MTTDRIKQEYINATAEQWESFVKESEKRRKNEPPNPLRASEDDSRVSGKRTGRVGC